MREQDINLKTIRETILFSMKENGHDKWSLNLSRDGIFLETKSHRGNRLISHRVSLEEWDNIDDLIESLSFSVNYQIDNPLVIP